MLLRLIGPQQAGRRAAAMAVALIAALAGCQGPAAAPSPSSTASLQPKPSASPSPRTSQVTPVAARQPGGHPRIMIIGDSITQGSAGDYTWQYWLYHHLRTDGIRPTMVGPYGWLYNEVTGAQNDQSYADPDFEHANDAFWGLTLFREKAAIGAEITTYQPDYLLVLLGLNDLFWYGISQAGMTANLDGFIAAARGADPSIRIVLGLIPPDIHERTNPTFAAGVASFNQTITTTAAQLSTAAAPVAVADDGAHINIAADLWDGTHPNTNGQIRIAAAFADVLARQFRVGKLYPTPFPVMPVGPLIPPHLIVRPSFTPRQARLLWTLSPGAESYYVYIKDVTRGNAAFKRLPYPLSPKQNPWTAGLLIPGHIYAFKLQACKGSDCGAFSNQASVKAP